MITFLPHSPITKSFSKRIVFDFKVSDLKKLKINQRFYSFITYKCTLIRSDCKESGVSKWMNHRRLNTVCRLYDYLYAISVHCMKENLKTKTRTNNLIILKFISYIAIHAVTVMTNFNTFKTDRLFHPCFTSTWRWGVKELHTWLIMDNFWFSQEWPLPVRILVAIFVSTHKFNFDIIFN